MASIGPAERKLLAHARANGVVMTRVAQHAAASKEIRPDEVIVSITGSAARATNWIDPYALVVFNAALTSADATLIAYGLSEQLFDGDGVGHECGDPGRAQRQQHGWRGWPRRELQ